MASSAVGAVFLVVPGADPGVEMALLNAADECAPGES